jgi:hypothetical protein
MCDVKRMFEERARLVIYLESSDMVRLTAVARGEGKTLVEWARGVLLAQGGPVEGCQTLSMRIPPAEAVSIIAAAPRNALEDVRQAPFKKRPPVKRRDPEPERGPKEQEVPPVVEPEKILEKPVGKTCAHGTAKGYNCWVCGGLAKVSE